MRTAALVIAALTLAATSNPADAQPLGHSPAATAPVSPSAETATLPSVMTRQPMFSIPFTLDPHAAHPVEVRLFVSADRGANWSFYTRARPADGAFMFRAKEDGLYWFAVRTVDQNLRLRPEGPLQPELQVLIDATGPQLELNAQAGPAGQIVTAWRASDDHLAAESLKIQYQPLSIHTVSTAPWRDVAVDVPRDGAPRATVSGEATWWPETPAQALNVRAEIRDRAGNVSVVNRRVPLPRVAWDQAPQLAAPVKPVTNPPADPFVQNRATPTPEVSSDQAKPPTATAWAADNERGSATGGQAIAKTPGNASETVTAPPAPLNEITQPADDGQIQPSRGSGAPPAREQFILANQPGETAAPTSLPEGVEPSWTNSRRLNLNYDIESVDPTGVKSVDLWVTQDGGRTWSSAGSDPDRKSPFTIEVNEDGEYGFRIVITSNGGLAGQPPKAGDAADLWIGVDTSQPAAEIISAPFGVADQAGHLTINWRATDQRLAERPIVLQFSQQAHGPWTTIADDLPNTGQYHWQVDASIPLQVYLRLEARDVAGNLAAHQLSRPISLAGLRPKAKIRGFEPVTSLPGNPAASQPVR